MHSSRPVFKLRSGRAKQIQPCLVSDALALEGLKSLWQMKRRGSLERMPVV